MNTRELLHVWASQSKEKGKCGNVFFEGASCYSYGHHFEMARITRGMVLMNERDYSATTRKHKSYCRGAVTDKTVIEVPSFEDHKGNIQSLLKGLESELFELSRARVRLEYRLSWYQGRVDTVLEYADTFKKEIGAKLHGQVVKVWKRRNEPFTPALRKQFEARALAAREHAKKERIEREARAAARKAELQAEYDGWKAGTVDRLPWGAMNLFPVALRIWTNEDETQVIETSRGATVPLIEARKLYHALKQSPAIDGMRIGHYTVTGVRGTDLIIGCHTIPMGEVARMAVKLGLESEAA